MDTQLVLKNTDRIVEVNGFRMRVHANHRPNRRNVICYSYLLQLYIIFNRLSKDNPSHRTIINKLILDLINKGMLYDLKVVEEKYY